MFERHQHARGLVLGTQEMNLREDATQRATQRLFALLFTRPGVASGLTVTFGKDTVTVAPGVALFPDQPGYRAVLVTATQTASLPTRDGTYGVYLNPEAITDREPITITPPQPGQAGYDPTDATPRILYRRRLREAFFSASAIPESVARVIQTGLSVTLRADAPPALLELAVFTVLNGTLAFSDPRPRPEALAVLRGFDQPPKLTPGQVGAQHLDPAIQDALHLAGALVTADRTDATLLATDGTRPLTGTLDLGGHTLTGFGADLDLGGHALSGVTALIRPDGAPITGNVTHLGGRTAEDLIREARATPGTPSAHVRTYAVASTLPLDDAHPTPTTVKVGLPSDLPSGARHVTFTGDGSLAGFTNTAATFSPLVRSTELPATALSYGGVAEGPGVTEEAFTVTQPTGLLGANAAFYVSCVRVYTESGQRRYQKTLQRLVIGAPQASIVDSLTGTLDLTDQMPSAEPINVTPDGTLTWGGRASGVTGNSGQPSTWVRGHTYSRANGRSVYLARGQLVVTGTLTVTTQDAVPTLAAAYA